MSQTSTSPAQVLTEQRHLPPTPPSESATDLTKMTTDLASVSANATSVARINTQHRHIWFITGPAGCGKTSTAGRLHTTYELPYLEGDTFHPPENIKKMAEGHPLTDADRWDWLILLREEAVKALKTANGVIVTCSALKRKYRDVLRIASYHHPEIKVHFVFLRASESALLDRVRARKNHYMKDSMVRSQFESLETPTEEEVDVLAVDASGTSEEVQKLAVAVVEKEMSNDSA